MDGHNGEETHVLSQQAQPENLRGELFSITKMYQTPEESHLVWMGLRTWEEAVLRLWVCHLANDLMGLFKGCCNLWNCRGGGNFLWGEQVSSPVFRWLNVEVLACCSLNTHSAKWGWLLAALVKLGVLEFKAEHIASWSVVLKAISSHWCSSEFTV